MTHPAEGKRLADRIEKARVVSLMEQPTVPGPVWAMPLSDEEQRIIVATLRSQGGKASLTSANLAALIHEARFPEGKDAPNYIPFLHEDRSGREYCLRIARKIIENIELVATTPSPAENSTRLIEVIEALIVSAEQNTDDDGNIYPHATRAIADARKFYREGT